MKQMCLVLLESNDCFVGEKCFSVSFRRFSSPITRELKKSTTVTAITTSLNKRFDEHNNICARAL